MINCNYCHADKGHKKILRYRSWSSFDKYWKPAIQKGDVEVTLMLDLPNTLNSNNKFFIPTDGSPFNIKLKLEENKNRYEYIALLVPSYVRFNILDEITKSSIISDKLIFIEKPFTNKLEEISQYRDIVESFHDRFHFAGKYAKGRADILVAKAKNLGIPERIKVNFIEGDKYWKVVNETLTKKGGTHTYIEDGPELDLGYHILDIAGKVFAECDDPLSSIDILVAEDASSNNEMFDISFVSHLQLRAFLASGRKVPIEIVVGKALTNTSRVFSMLYKGGMKLWQEYLTNCTADPVYIEKGEKTFKIASHPLDYLYYSEELKESEFVQSKSDQLLAVYLNEVCIKAKNSRQQI